MSSLLANKIDFSKTQYWLAPLAGWTDLPFRETVKKFGADLTVSEMISSNALVYNVPKTKKLIEKSVLEDPYSVQISGSDKSIIKDAVMILNDIDGIDVIDLNSGCPAPKIVRNGNGSSLLKDLKLLQTITQTIKLNSKKQYTSVKVRIGFNEKYPVEIGKAVQDGGADFIVVHGRTRSGFYDSEVDYDAIRMIKEALNIPVIANGDITDFQKAKDVLQYTKCDGVMIGRGAMGHPWIFKQLKENMSEPSIELKKEIIKNHLENMISFHGEYGGVLFRKHLHRYSKGIKEASTFRDSVNYSKSNEELFMLIDKYFIRELND